MIREGVKINLKPKETADKHQPKISGEWRAPVLPSKLSNINRSGSPLLMLTCMGPLYNICAYPKFWDRSKLLRAVPYKAPEPEMARNHVERQDRERKAYLDGMDPRWKDTV